MSNKDTNMEMLSSPLSKCDRLIDMKGSRVVKRTENEIIAIQQ